jgi:hypothetical protein
MTPTTTILITASSGLIGTVLPQALEQRSLVLRRFDLRDEVSSVEETLRQDAAIRFVAGKYKNFSFKVESKMLLSRLERCQ